jgi:methyl-accepting chemotaxis protein
MNLSAKLIVTYLACGLIPLGIVGVLSYTTADESLSNLSEQGSVALDHAAQNQLVALRDVKKNQIEGYFEERQGDMGVLVETVQTLRAEAFEKLEAVREVKRRAVERYFKTIEGQIVTFAADAMIVDAMRELAPAFQAYREDAGATAEGVAEQREALRGYYAGAFANTYREQNDGTEPPIEDYFALLDEDAVALQFAYIQDNPNPLGEKHRLDAAADGTTYNALHAKLHPVVRQYLEEFGYYDIFLVDSDTGDIVYSVFKELDFGTSLIDGPYAETNFGEAFRAANAAQEPGEIVLVDYKRYPPSYEAPASFIASPIFDGSEKVGVAMFQMPIDRLNVITAERAGLGETGETYLVGPDFLMRSDSYLDPKHHSVAASFADPTRGRAETDGVRAALTGESGTRVIRDYNGNPVLSAYCPVDLKGIRWALLAEVDVAEAFCPRVPGAEKDFFTQYTEKYGYYDLFLLNPDGYCFYTVAQEADYQTNLVSGKYRDSNLGELVRRVLDSQQFGFADFRPYAPSNGDQAAFIAQPVVSNGKVEAVVALQLPADAINAIMTLRTGMGETGCTYLLGRDEKGEIAFRSDMSFAAAGRGRQRAGLVAGRNLQRPRADGRDDAHQRRERQAGQRR